MSQAERNPFKLSGPGPYIGIVKNHLDNTFMGGLEVAIIRGSVDDTELVEGQLVQVKYLSPFFGTTNVSYNGNNGKLFRDTQKSYGMWMVPPDVGTKVMVIFVDGDYSQGYWIGCVPEKFQNYMVPGLAAGLVDESWLPGTKAKYQTNLLPVAEHNKKDPQGAKLISNRPVHPFADALAEQGLLKDPLRGVTSSSARREIPSQVFGISTPGPLDPGGPKRNDGYGGRSCASTPVSRLGGSTFVMDDGDEKGDSELIRLRTRSGLQVLLHNTADLVYIANSKGTAWIELTSNGKIDIFAEDSVSIHTESDFNFRADRNVNIEAGNNINLRSGNNMSIDVNGDLAMLIRNDAVITSRAKLTVNSKGDLNIATPQSVKLTGEAGIDIVSDSAINVKTSAQMFLSASAINQAAAGPGSKADATLAKAIDITNVPLTTGSAGWSNSYGAGTLSTMLQRVPMHEPWSQHESLNPLLFSSQNTDNTPASGTYTPTPVTPTQSGEEPVFDATQSLVFTSGTGDAAHFAKVDSGLQSAIKAAASDFKAKTGRPVVITSAYRSDDEQMAIYNRWRAAGGIYPRERGPNDPGVPKAAGIMIPVKPTPGKSSMHARGLALDTPQAAQMEALGILAKNGLYRPVPLADPVHITLR